MPRFGGGRPKLAPLIGRASPKNSKNYGGLNKGVDMPNEAAMAVDTSPLGVKLGSAAPGKHEIPTSFGANKSFLS